jgi:hypothetical protein
MMLVALVTNILDILMLSGSLVRPIRLVYLPLIKCMRVYLSLAPNP